MRARAAASAARRGARARARRSHARRSAPTVVLSPALGGVVIGQEVGRALGVRAIFAERQDGALTLRRGFTLAGQRSRARRRGRADDRRLDARDDARWRGPRAAQVVGAASIVDRSGGTARVRRAVRVAARHRAADLRARHVSALRAGLAGREAGSRPCA